MFGMLKGYPNAQKKTLQSEFAIEGTIAVSVLKSGRSKLECE
jgi:hypothetical protein